MIKESKMFVVVVKGSFETYKVYATKTVYKNILFLIYHDSKWDWCNANLFEPCE
jgi:hypothetical protein